MMISPYSFGILFRVQRDVFTIATLGSSSNEDGDDGNETLQKVYL